VPRLDRLSGGSPQGLADAAGITDGPLFRRVNKGGRPLPDRLTAQSVAIIVKAYAARLGLDADAFSGHSRAGFLTSAAAGGASLVKMMDVSRHKSVEVLLGYLRDAEAFRRGVFKLT
jgi:hypothetical protein